jgi:hypothetical protein
MDDDQLAQKVGQIMKLREIEQQESIGKTLQTILAIRS